MLIGWIAKSANTQVASVRYRCLAPMEALVARGVPVELYSEANKDNYSLVIFSKVYTPKDQELASYLKQHGIRTVLDLCDNHFYNPKNIPNYVEGAKNLRQMLGLVDGCICSTAALKDELLKNVTNAPPVWVVGDAVEELPPLKKAWWSSWLRKKRPILLWQGIHGVPNAECGMLDILKIKHHLSSLAREFDFELIVLSNNREKYKAHIQALPFRTRYVEWSLMRLRSLLGQAAAVVIPVTENPFTICKTNNRLALPLAYGVPVIADSIPSYSEFAPYAFLDQWEQGLRAVLSRRADALTRTELGRQFVIARYSAVRIGEEWRGALMAAHDIQVVTGSRNGS